MAQKQPAHVYFVDEINRLYDQVILPATLPEDAVKNSLLMFQIELRLRDLRSVSIPKEEIQGVVEKLRRSRLAPLWTKTMVSDTVDDLLKDAL